MNRTIKAIFILTLLAAVSFYLFVQNIGEDTNDESPSISSENSQKVPVLTNEEPTVETKEVVDETPEVEEKPNQGSNKPAIIPITGTDMPTVYTGYGHDVDNPLKKGQNTSTICTTSAGADCYIEFTNNNTSEVVTFDSISTNSQGIANWSWVGGKDVSSGEWTVLAITGELKSSKETIFIK